jgi:UPF0042 nucleotide-binding protein
MKLIIITGLSGSGKSVALHTLEDLGYYAIDNLPVFLLQELARRLAQDPVPALERTAVGIDARNASGNLGELPALVKEMRQKGLDCQTLFLDASDETLIKRFSETRRKHPLADRKHSLEEAMVLERRLLEPVLSNADLHIDTTHTNVHQLRDQVRARVEQSGDGMSILLLSFGFKHGVPPDVDYVFDVRCLPNPHWQPDLRPLTGRDEPVARFLEADPGVKAMLADLSGFLDRWIPAFEADARSYLTIGIGCTGGQHRSVYITEQLGKHLNEGDHAVLVRHRELPA